MAPASRPPAALAFIFLTLVIDLLGVGLVIPVMPELVRQLTGDADATAHALGLLMSLYAAMQFLFAPLLGGLSDAYGRRPVLLASALGTAAGSLVVAWAPTLGWLYAARLLSGATSANISAANAYIADISTPETRARNFGMIGVAFGVGFVAGPALGGVLGAIDLRLPFLTSAGLSLISFLYGLLVLPESHPPERRGRLNPKRLNPLGSLRALRLHPGISSFAAALTLITLGNFFIMSTWVLHGTERYGWSTQSNGAALAVSGILGVLVQALLLPIVVRRLGEKRILFVALGLGAFANVLYGFASEPWMVFAAMLPGALAGLGNPAAQSLLAARVPASEQGTVQGAVASLGGLAAIVGPLCATSLFAHFTSAGAAVRLPGIAFFGTSGLLLLAVPLVALSLRSPQPRVEARPELAP